MNHYSQWLSAKTMPSFALASWGEKLRNGKLERMPQWAGFYELNSQIVQKHLARMQTTRRNSQWASKVCWDLLPTPNNFEFWAKLLKMSPFLGDTLLGRSEGTKGRTQSQWKKIMVQLLGLFFPAVQSSFGLHCWIERKLLALYFLPHCVNYLHLIKAFLCHVTI